MSKKLSKCLEALIEINGKDLSKDLRVGNLVTQLGNTWSVPEEKETLVGYIFQKNQFILSLWMGNPLDGQWSSHWCQVVWISE